MRLLYIFILWLSAGAVQAQDSLNMLPLCLEKIADSGELQENEILTIYTKGDTIKACKNKLSDKAKKHIQILDQDEVFFFNPSTIYRISFYHQGPDSTAIKISIDKNYTLGKGQIESVSATIYADERKPELLFERKR